MAPRGRASVAPEAVTGRGGGGVVLNGGGASVLPAGCILELMELMAVTHFECTDVTEGRGCPLQHSGLENSMGCVAHGVTRSRTRPSDFH